MAKKIKKKVKRPSIKRLPKGSFKLPIQTATLVPSTLFDKRVSATIFRKRVDETRRFLSKLFGGYTSVQVKGGFVSKKGTLIKEPIALIVAYSQKKGFITKKKLWF